MRTVLVLATFVSTLAARADILNVPKDFPTIQAAIDAAQDGDEIVLASGTYTAGILVDRTLSVTIRSTDPTNPLVVEQTIIAGGGRAIDAIVGPNESISLLFDGVTLRRDDPMTTLALIRSIGPSLELRRCVLNGGVQPAASNLIFASDAFAAPPGNASLRIIDSRFDGSIGSIGFDLPLTEIIGCTADNASIRFDIRPRETQTFRMTDCEFESIPGVRDDPLIRVDNPTLPSGPLGAVHLERLAFRDFARAVIGTDQDIELRDFTIERVATEGGVIMTLRDATIDGLILRESGGLEGDFFGLIQASTIVARNVVAEDNMTEFGIFHVLGEPNFEVQHTFEDCLFARNTSKYSIIEVHGIGSLTRCDFIDNRIVNISFGGGPFVNFGARNRRLTGPASIADCRFIGNSSELGAAVVLPNSASGASPDNVVTITNTEFIGNTGASGVIEIGDPNRARAGFPQLARLRQCLIVGNTTGSGIHIGSTRYEQSTIAGNFSSGLQLGLGDAELVNTIFVPGDPAGTMADVVDDDPVTIDAMNSIVPDAIADLPTASDIVRLNPLFVRDPDDGGDGWGDNPDTPDVDESANDDFGDLRPAGNSPAIDAGDPTLVTVGATDLGGLPRIADDPGVPGDAIDIGAYEFQGTSCLPDTNQDGALTAADFNAWILAFNERSPLADQNRDGAITPADFNGWILNFNGGC